MNGLSLFSGIGGIDVALSGYVRPIAYCEIDPYCQAVLLNRQFDGLLPIAPIWDDVSTLRVQGNGRNIDIIYGGFPCQDISVAGHGAGLEGKRSGLFYEIMRLAKEIKPKFIFLEKVPAITTRGGLQVVREIAEMGYDCRWCHVSAGEVGAIHKRERFFLLAHNGSERIQGFSKKQVSWKSNIQKVQDERGFKDLRERSNLFTPKLCGSGNGIRFRMERTHALGNAVVPCQAKKAFEILMGINA